MSDKKARLLIVDDVDLNRDFLSRGLTRKGYEVETAEHGGLVMPILAQRTFDVVLLDIMMPHMDGIQVLKLLRKQFSPSDLAVVMMSGRNESDTVVEAFRLGANDYVTKPIDLAVLLARVGALVARRRVEAAVRPAGDAPDVGPGPWQPVVAADGAEELQVGSVLGRYTLLRPIGKGGMGTVYEAEDMGLGRRVAVKAMSRKYAEDARWVDRFRGEARAAARIEHPNVVGIYEVNISNGHLFIAMQMVNGESVRKLIERRGRLPWEEATRIVLEACRGLAAAHARGVLHRDVKPDNLIVGGDGGVKLLDFGLAKITDQDASDLAQSGVLRGTPHYMSPEQWRSLPAEPPSDLYQMGATYYTLLTGQRPYFEKVGLFSIMEAHCSSPPPDPRRVFPDIPAPCSDIVLQAMQKEPQQRQTSAAEMVSALERVLDTLASPKRGDER